MEVNDQARKDKAGKIPESGDSVIAWLLDADPSVRWQTMQDLTEATKEEIAAERKRVAAEGWGAQLLALQAEDGSWAGEAWNEEWNSTMHVMTLLRELGLDPQSDEARRATDLVRERVAWRGWDWEGKWNGWDFRGTPYFAGEVEPCINGQVATSGVYFGQDVDRIMGLLLGEQLADGGWNCECANGSKRSSFNTTICVLEALLEYELAGGNRGGVKEARLRGQEYLLERHLLRRLTTGEVVNTAWTRFSFPNWWHYDVLRGLDYMRKAGVVPDERMAEAIGLVESKRGDDGRWALEHRHPGTMAIEMDEDEGRPSRWITLRALRVLKWYADGRS